MEGEPPEDNPSVDPAGGASKQEQQCSGGFSMESGIQVTHTMGEMNTFMTSSHPSLLKLSSSKLEGSSGSSNAALRQEESLKSAGEEAAAATRLRSSDHSPNHHEAKKLPASAPPQKTMGLPPLPDPSGVVSPEHPAAGPSPPPAATTTGSGVEQLPAATQPSHPPPVPPPAPSSATSAPLKATAFSHLKQKYLHELEYMLTEFQKLERQLLGAKAATRETDGSRERREKLHSFIVHLQDTIQQIRTGCQLEAQGKSAGGGGGATTATDNSKASSSDDALKGSALLHLTAEKREEETVQKLEEHILANLLPVKVRLKKQLAAQQGAKHNPAGMPVRGTSLAASSMHHPHDKGKATFAAAADESRRRASLGMTTAPPASSHSSSSHFGMPLEGGGSCLTQKLHGPTLGSANRLQEGGGASAAASSSSAAPTTEKAEPATKILYAGLAIGSDQHESSVTAASAVHAMVIKEPALMELARHQRHHLEDTDESNLSLPDADLDPAAAPEVPDRVPSHRASLSPRRPPASAPATTVMMEPAAANPLLGDDDPVRRLLKKKRKRRKLRGEEPSSVHKEQPDSAANTSNNKKTNHQGSNKRKKRGPWPVEYMCALCNEVYGSTCEYNPWWALQQQECPKCHKTQIPRIDIGAPANAIEYHPALLAHAEENGTGAAAGGGGPAGSTVQASSSPPSHVKAGPASFPATTVPKESSDSESTGSDLSDEDWEGLLSEDSDDDLSDSDLSDPDALAAMSPADQAEHERFGEGYTGPKLSEADSSRLLVLMAHATTCPCQHKVPKLRDVCLSTKWMMLHVRDCPGTTSTFDVCPFPWCRKVKHLLYHLVSCQAGEACPICNPEKIHVNLRRLQGLNKYRLKRYRERLISRMKAASVTAKTKSTEPDETASSDPMEIVPSEDKSLDYAVGTANPTTVAKTDDETRPPSSDDTHPEQIISSLVHAPITAQTDPDCVNPKPMTPSEGSERAADSQLKVNSASVDEKHRYRDTSGLPPSAAAPDKNEVSKPSHPGGFLVPSPPIHPANSPMPIDDSKTRLGSQAPNDSVEQDVSPAVGESGDACDKCVADSVSSLSECLPSASDSGLTMKAQNQSTKPVQDVFLANPSSALAEVGSVAAGSLPCATDSVNPECSHTVVTDSSSSYSAPLDTEGDAGTSCNAREILESQQPMEPDQAEPSKEEAPAESHGSQQEPLSVP